MILHFGQRPVSGGNEIKCFSDAPRGARSRKPKCDRHRQSPRAETLLFQRDLTMPGLAEWSIPPAKGADS